MWTRTLDRVDEEVQGDHVGVQCVQGELKGDQGHNGVQSSHINEIESEYGQGH